MAGTSDSEEDVEQDDPAPVPGGLTGRRANILVGDRVR